MINTNRNFILIKNDEVFLCDTLYKMQQKIDHITAIYKKYFFHEHYYYISAEDLKISFDTLYKNNKRVLIKYLNLKPKRGETLWPMILCNNIAIMQILFYNEFTMRAYDISWYKELLDIFKKIPMDNPLTQIRREKLYRNLYFSFDYISAYPQCYTPETLFKVPYNTIYKLSLKCFTQHDRRLFLYYIYSNITNLLEKGLIKFKTTLIFPLDEEQYAKEFCLPSFWVNKSNPMSQESLTTYLYRLEKELLKINPEELYKNVVNMFFLFNITCDKANNIVLSNFNTIEFPFYFTLPQNGIGNSFKIEDYDYEIT